MADKEMIILPLGKVGLCDRGEYNSETPYQFLNFIVTEDSCYFSLKNENTGHPVSDKDWWRCIANGKQATEAAKKALAATADAIEKAAYANNAAVRAGSAALLAEQRSAEAREAKEDVLSVLDEMMQMLVAGKIQIASMKAAELSLMNQALLAPSLMELKYTPVICIRNKVRQKIQALLYPGYVLQNVIYQQPPRLGDSVYIEPDGSLTLNKPGTTKIQVIPTHNISLWQTAEITVREPVIRKLGNGCIRLDNNRNIRLI